MSVIVSRALPESATGSSRRSVGCCSRCTTSTFISRAKSVKCAKIAGDTQGNYHPHGQEVIYPTLVRMAQPFSLRYQLIDGQGNFGNIDGLPPAAMRYTEARMAPVAEELLADLDKDTVDTVMNYDESRKGSVVLPGRFPNLICNGAQGIAVGMATSFPRTTSSKSATRSCCCSTSREATLQELLAIVPGPDFRPAASSAAAAASSTATAPAAARSRSAPKHEFEEAMKRPHQHRLHRDPVRPAEDEAGRRIAQSVRTRRSRASRTSKTTRTAKASASWSCSQGRRPERGAQQLFTFTPLQDTVSVIMLAIVNNGDDPVAQVDAAGVHQAPAERHPETHALLLRKARNRAHLLEGLLVALSSIGRSHSSNPRFEDVAEARASLLALEVSAALMERALGAESIMG